MGRAKGWKRRAREHRYQVKNLIAPQLAGAGVLAERRRVRRWRVGAVAMSFLCAVLAVTVAILVTGCEVGEDGLSGTTGGKEVNECMNATRLVAAGLLLGCTGAGSGRDAGLGSGLRAPGEKPPAQGEADAGVNVDLGPDLQVSDTAAESKGGSADAAPISPDVQFADAAVAKAAPVCPGSVVAVANGCSGLYVSADGKKCVVCAGVPLPCYYAGASLLCVAACHDCARSDGGAQ